MIIQEETNLYGKFAVIANTGLLLIYAIPKKIENIQTGKFCLLPMKRGKEVKTYVGLFLGFCDPPEFSCQFILEFAPYTKKVPDNLLSTIKWASEYYLIPFEKMLPFIAPSFVWNVEKYENLQKKLSKMFIKLDENMYNINANIFCKLMKGEIKLPLREHIDLTEEQNFIFQKIITKKEGTILLHGVTGSGKTEIYLKISQIMIANQKTVLVLVPEIVLTPQMSARFRAVFQNNLAILHSKLTTNEYEREWFKIHLGFAKVVLGVRTSVFSLLENIGVIIVDEEHDTSYKSQDFPCYHARDLAVLRAKTEKALCILGSATPSIESMYNAMQGKYSYFKLENKYSNHTVDSVVIDTKKYINLPSKLKFGKYPLKSSQIVFENDGISFEVLNLLKENKEKNEQSIIIVNRRGFVNYALCAECASPLICPNCSVTTTIHNNGVFELCHYCGFRIEKRKNCPSCHSSYFINHGIGTQNVEEQIQKHILNLKIARLDKDVLTSNSRLTEIIENFRIGETDCLIGTQMLAKGHDFPNVTLVVILHVEDSLFLPDFRSSERTFQLLTQAMGRAGRGQKKGKVVLQSLVIGHPVIEMSLSNNVEEFVKRELSLRRLGFHPPYSRQILIEIRNKKRENVLIIANKIKSNLVIFWEKNNYSISQIHLAGPYFATIEKLNNDFRMHLCISSAREIHPVKIIPESILRDKELLRYMKIDVDPYSFL